MPSFARSQSLRRPAKTISAIAQPGELQDLQFEDLMEALSQLSHLQLVRDAISQENQTLREQLEQANATHATKTFALQQRLCAQEEDLDDARQQLLRAKQELADLDAAHTSLREAHSTLRVESAGATMQVDLQVEHDTVRQRAVSEKIQSLVKENVVLAMEADTVAATAKLVLEREAYTAAKLEFVEQEARMAHERLHTLGEEKQADAHRWAQLLADAHESALNQSEMHQEMYAGLLATCRALGQGICGSVPAEAILPAFVAAIEPRRRCKQKAQSERCRQVRAMSVRRKRRLSCPFAPGVKMCWL